MGLPNAAASFAGRFRRIDWLLAAALVIAGAAAWPLWSQPGLLNTRGGGDSPFLLQRLHQLVAALADGHFPVRWMPDANYGYGYPFYNYYAALSIYIAAAFRFLGFGFVQAIKLAQLAGFLAAAWGAFALGKRWLGGGVAGLLASAAYTLAPFHLVNVYVRGDSLAEFWAMAFYPLVLLAADRLVWPVQGPVGRRSWTGAAWLALAYAGLILSHNISALIFTPFLLLYLGLVFRRQRGQAGAERRLALAGLGLLLGLLLSAWFWLPALSEQSLAQLGPVTKGYFHYSNHFRSADLVQPGLLFDYDVSGGRAFAMGLVQAGLIVAGLVAGLAAALGWSRGRGATQSGEMGGDRGLIGLALAAAALLVASLMITPLSRPLWDNLPLLPFTQFPWRFLSVQALAGALVVAALARWRPLAFGAVALLLVAGLAGLRVDHLPLSDTDVTAQRLAQYEWFTGNVGSTVSAEYLPQTVEVRPYTSPWLNDGQRERLQVLEGTLTAEAMLARQATSQTWQLGAAAEGAQVVFPTLYWPGWQAQVDGRAAEIGPAPGSGLISLAVPAGEHQVDLQLGRTPARASAEGLSLASAVVVAGLLLVGRGKMNWRPWAAGAAALLLLALAARLWPEGTQARDRESWDFAQLGYLHQAAEAIRFEDGAALAGYEYDRETVAPGESLAVTLMWQGPPAGRVELALATPAVNRFAQAPMAAAQRQKPSESMRFVLAVPENAPAGLYAPTVRLADAQALTPAGQLRGDLFLRPVRVAAARQPGESATGLDARLQRVTYQDGLALEVQLQWLTGRPLSRNLAVSLRLQDEQGQWLAQFDSQPGYGFLPSSGWPAGEWIDDWLSLPLPSDLAPGEAGEVLDLVANLYDPAGEAEGLTRRLGQLAWQGGKLAALEAEEAAVSLPADLAPVSSTFGDVIRLQGYTLAQEERALAVTLYWQALEAPQADYRHFVHLIPVDGEEIVAQHDAFPRHNSYPTGQWSAGEMVADGLSLDLRQVAAGQYRLAVGLYQKLGKDLPRLAVRDEGDRALPDDRLLLPEVITIQP